MELMRSRSSSFEGKRTTTRLSKKLEWHSYFEPTSIFDDQVTSYIYTLQCFVLECNAVAERHKTVVLEQTAKINELEAYLEGRINQVDWNQFDCINFQPLTFSFPPAPSNRPSDHVLKHERVEVVAYIDVLEMQACKSMRHMETLAQELKFFADLVEKLNEEVWTLDVSSELERPPSASMVRTSSTQKKRRRISLLRLQPSKKFPFLHCLFKTDN